MSLKMEWVNIAKGIGVIFVVLGHLLRGLNNANLFIGSAFNTIDYVIYSFHMPLFFFLSGIFFVKSFNKRGFNKFIKDKFSTLFYLYIVWSIIFFVFQFMLNNFTNGNTQLADLFSVIYQPNGIMWFLYSLLILFVFNALIISLFPKKTYKLACLFLVILGVFLRYFDITEIHLINKTFKSLLFFQIGILFSVSFKQSLISFKQQKLLALLTGVLFVIMLVNNLLEEDVVYHNQIITTFFGVCFICLISSLLKFNGLKYLGKYSLEIYLLHIFFASGFRIVLHKFLGIENLFIHISLGLLFGLMGPLIIIEIKKRFTFLNVLFKAPIKTTT